MSTKSTLKAAAVVALDVDQLVSQPHEIDLQDMAAKSAAAAIAGLHDEAFDAAFAMRQAAAWIASLPSSTETEDGEPARDAARFWSRILLNAVASLATAATDAGEWFGPAIRAER